MMDLDVITDRDSSAWLARLRSGRMTAADQRQFDAWLKNPANRADFQALSHAYEGLSHWADDPVVFKARTAALQRASKPPLRTFLPIAAAIVAAVAVALLLFTMPGMVDNGPQPEKILTTAANQRQYATLEDGSQLVLDGNTKIAVRFNKDKRQVFLRQGRAYFAVAKDPTRPFVVHTGLGSVYAVGTAFSVDGRKEGMKVLLTEGKVRVKLEPTHTLAARKTIDMLPGTELSADRKGWAVQRAPVDHALAWTEGFIVFDDTRLADAVAEFNAVSRRTLVLGPGLGQQRISGTFRSGMAEDFSRALEAYGIARIESQDEKQIRLIGPTAK